MTRAVSSGGIVLEILDQSAWLRTLKKDLGLALVDFATTVHWESGPLGGGIIWPLHALEKGEKASSFAAALWMGITHSAHKARSARQKLI
jgi:hypothetical protein